jgi:hypothetical protein
MGYEPRILERPRRDADMIDQNKFHGGFNIKWTDHGREPQYAPDPKFPDGVGLDLSKGAKNTCCASLPYPARRCGFYSVVCCKCKIKVAITTAGRVDDPRSVIIACKGQSA